MNRLVVYVTTGAALLGSPFMALTACGDGGAGATTGSGGGVAIELTAEAGQPRYALVGELVAFDGSASTGAKTYSWNFGDGDAWEAPRDSPTADHTYAEPGRYTAVLTVFDAAGQKRSDAVLISVTLPLVHEPVQSSTVSTLPERDELVVVSPDSDEVTRMAWDQAGALSVVDRTTVAAHPRTLSVWNGRILVACQDDATVELLGIGTSRSLTVAMPYGSQPFAAIGRGDEIFVSLASTGQLARVSVDESSATVTELIDGLPDARGLALLPDGRIAVTRWRSPDDEGVVNVVDPQDGSVSPWTVAFDDQLGSDTESGGVPTYLEQLLVSPNGVDAVLPSLQANYLDGGFLNGSSLTHETTVRAVISYLNVPSGQESYERRKQFDDRGFATAGVMSSRGDYLYLAMRGSRAVDRIDMLTGGQAGSILDVGYAPQGVALSHDDRFLFVDAYLSREIVAYDVSDLSSPPTPTFSAAIPSAEPLAPITLRGKQLFNDSFDTRIAKDGYIACAHCHLDGLDDRRTWDFTDRGEGLRNTISLIGRSGEAPIHWSANFDEVQDFEHDIRGAFSGTGLMSDDDFASGTVGETLGDSKAGLSDDLDALAAYVESLTTYPVSPYRMADGSLGEAAERGKLLFDDPAIGCVTCHSGPSLSDSQLITPTEPVLHDVGTLGAGSGMRLGGPLLGIDTPSLHGVWATAPYLHDGSASTLLDVLTTKNPADQHGVTSGLSAAELDDLVAYLSSLDGRVD